MSRTRLGGAALGFGIAGLPGALAAAAIEIANPAFVDGPLSYWALAVAVPGLIGAVVGALVGAVPRRAYAALPVASALIVAGLSIGDGVHAIPGLQLLVVGVDGATWTVAQPLVDGGEMPTLARLEREGAHGVMHSHDPMFSPLLWTTMAAGKPPEEHGVHGFQVHATDCLVPRFWDVAEHEGRSVGLFEWLVTWPPRRLAHGGFVVPAWLAPSPETEPEDLSFLKEIELSRRLERKKVAARRPSWKLAEEGVLHGFRWTTVRDAALWSVRERVLHPDEDARTAFLQDLRVRMARDVFLWAAMRDQPQLLTFTDYATDALGHRFWGRGDVLRDAYVQADGVLADVLRLVPEQGRVVVVSDHGFRALDVDKDGAIVSPRTSILEDRLAREVGPVQVARVGAKVTVSLTGDADAEKTALDVFLSGVVRADGTKLYRWYPVPGDARAWQLDLLAKHVDPHELDEPVDGAKLGDWVEVVQGMYGDHDPAGLFVAWGPGVTPGAQADVDLMDLAPVYLAAMGLPRGEDMTGRVPAGVWPEAGVAPSWDPIRQQIAFPDVAGQGVDDEMLKALGYVDR